MPGPSSDLRLSRWQFQAGERVAVAVSGGADSTALLLGLTELRQDLGLVVSAIHVHHGLRGDEADQDQQFVAELTGRLQVPLRIETGNTERLAGERGRGIEEAARALRYQAFEALLRERTVDCVATAHTLDDQAETVLMKLLRGAWLEGLAGIAPTLPLSTGRIVRPLLATSRAEVIAYLKHRAQPWREDSTNTSDAFTRNRVRRQLLPELDEFAPGARDRLANLATLARDEESWWERELTRVLPGLLLPGKPVRGGGRASSTQPGAQSVAVELDRLRALHPAMQRRVLRAAAEQIGAKLDFAHTEQVRGLVLAEDGTGKRGRLDLRGGVMAEKSLRELRLTREPEGAPSLPAEHAVPVPGEAAYADYGVRVTVQGALEPGEQLILRVPRAGDKVLLRHSRGLKTVKDVLERGGWSAQDRAAWPVLACGSRILWMQRVDVEPRPGLDISVVSL